MEKIKLFAKRNAEEKKDNRKLIEKVEDWVNDDHNWPLITYGMGVTIGVVGGVLIGKCVQAAKDAKEIVKIKNLIADSFINMSSGIKIDPVISNSETALAIQGLNVNGDVIGFNMTASSNVARNLANNLLSVVDKVDPPITEVSAESIAKTMIDMGYNNVKIV